jgi:hypothetical protein
MMGRAAAFVGVVLDVVLLLHNNLWMDQETMF